MENAKMIELAIGFVALGAIFIGGYLFARQSDRATLPKASTK
jgi:hypothetical protein